MVSAVSQTPSRIPGAAFLPLLGDGHHLTLGTVIKGSMRTWPDLAHLKWQRVVTGSVLKAGPCREHPSREGAQVIR